MSPTPRELRMTRQAVRCAIHWPAGFVVRRPRKSDVPVLTALDHEGMSAVEVADLDYPDSVQRFFDYIPANADEELSVATSTVVLSDDEVVAFCLFVVERGGEAHLYNIHVAGHHRRKGVATGMIQHGMGVVFGQCTSVTLEGVVPGDPAHRLYTKLGFVEQDDGEPGG